MNIIRKTFLTVLTTIIVAAAISAYANATPVVGFEAGRIIDDIVFTYSQSMNTTQIQNFLNSKMPVCDTWHTGFYGTSGTWYGPPFTCLKDYSENGLTASQIMYNAAQTYHINPQVLLVLLQKEQSLITDTWPASYQYKTATGYGCPDGAPCNELYYGFTNQINNAANMFRKILDAASGWYTPYSLGNNYIQYNPNSGCGGTIVNIQNRSTQALYNYTPYQPNPSVLNAGYGLGDSCGAYGNRNFYVFFTDWFGPTKRRLVKTADSNSIYQVENDTKRGFTSEEVFLSYGYKWTDVLTITSGEMSSIPDGPTMPYNANYRNWQLVKVSGSTGVYLVYNGAKRGFLNEETFLSQGYKWSDVVTISPLELSLIPDGAPMPYNPNYRNGQLVKINGNSSVYIVSSGYKNGIPSDEVFLSYGYKWTNVREISLTELGLIPNGTTVDYNVNLRNGQLVKTTNSTGIYLIYNGAKRGFPNEETFLSQGYKWSDIVTVSTAELALIPTGADMPYNPNFRNWQLVRIPNSTGIYLVYNGTKRGFQNEETFLSHGYKWSDIVIISTTELALIPTGADMPYNPNYRNGQLVEVLGSTGVYLVSNGTKRGFPNEQTFLSYGYSWSIIKIISTTELSMIPDGLDMAAKT